MAAGLRPFPISNGRSGRDRCYFDIDTDLSTMQRLKRAPPLGIARLRYFDIGATAAELAARDCVVGWMHAKLHEECPPLAALARADSAAQGPLDALGRAVPEDIALLHRGENGFGKLVAAHVSFPGGWRPEALAGADFCAIHAPVPGFPGRDTDTARKRDAISASLVDAMISRGPYARFVWTVSADSELDHHPDAGTRQPWTPECAGFFRCERQVTVPFPEHDSALFLIRTYVTSFVNLTPSQLIDLRHALQAMPESIAVYKGLSSARGHIDSAIERAMHASASVTPPTVDL
jgi:Protein of unknown function (DUF3445)